MASDPIHILVTGADGQLGSAFRRSSRQAFRQSSRQAFRRSSRQAFRRSSRQAFRQVSLPEANVRHQQAGSKQAFRQMMPLAPAHFHFTFANRKTLDLTDQQAVQSALKNADYCINCAAYTAVDQAEKEPERAFEINAESVKHLAKACKQNNCKLIHFSTDYVYDSGQTTPYRESDPVHARSIYAQSKLLGEGYALEEQQDTIVLRTSWLFSPFGKNFYTSMLRLGKERKSLGVVYDQIGTPTSALHLAKAVLQIIQKIEDGLPDWQGIYNYSEAGVASWYDFAHEIMRLHHLPCEVYPIRTEAFPRPAARPAFSLMDKSKICSTFALKLEHWTKAVKELTHVE